MYIVNTTNLAWFAIYLNGRKRYIKITESADSVKKGTKMWIAARLKKPLLVLLYRNDLPNSSNLLVPIMFADDTFYYFYFYLFIFFSFFEYSNINTLLKTVNDELIKIKEGYS